MKHLILNQLGTPNSPTPEDVGIYLSEFLMDPRIITLPRPLRDILVKIGIVPRRKFSSAEKYKKVWTKRGSPLAFHTQDLQNKMQNLLGGEWQVHVAMRYGSTSINSCLNQITEQSQADEIYFLPLYPQYATATVASAVDEIECFQKNTIVSNPIKVLKPFYNESWYIKSLVNELKKHMTVGDHLLFSYHGIPVSQEKNAPESYYQQCLKTSELVCAAMQLPLGSTSTAFQSRVGLAKWLEPSTEKTTIKLAQQGVKTLTVLCPSFVADCLETIEEIGLELQETFIHSGGQNFKLVPCLNSSDLFAEGLVSYLQANQSLKQIE